jgi:sugar (pentulose or hexulose) kinase
MENIGFKIDAFNAVGGGCNSSTWVQIISDVTGRPMHLVKNHLEAGAAGAALAVSVGLGIHKSMDDVDDLVEIKRTVIPSNGEHMKRYDDLYHVYRDLYTALIPTYRSLAEIK